MATLNQSQLAKAKAKEKSKVKKSTWQMAVPAVPAAKKKVVAKVHKPLPPVTFPHFIEQKVYLEVDEATEDLAEKPVPAEVLKVQSDNTVVPPEVLQALKVEIAATTTVKKAAALPTPTASKRKGYTTPRTQKAKGVLAGQALMRNGIFGGMFMTNHLLITCEADLNKPPLHGMGETFRFDGSPVFARPCPVRPRHGFIESRKIKTKQEAMQLLEEVLKEDPEGELLVSAFHDSSFSGVVTEDGNLSIGPGHDGATGGHGSKMLQVLPYGFPAIFKKIISVAETDSVYMEYVLPKNSYHPVITQLRGGPKITPMTDFIPTKMKISGVVTPVDDLLAWEKQVKTLPEGTVVYGAGHTLASHAAVHCICSNVPFITSFEPKVGEEIEPKEGDTTFTMNREEFMAGFQQEVATDHPSCTEACKAAIAILHNWATISRHPSASRLLGRATNTFWRLSVAAIVGELRHGLEQTTTVSRDHIYAQVVAAPQEYTATLSLCPRLFANGRWRAGYGGGNWAKCSLGTVAFNRALCDFIDGKIEAPELIAQMNRMVNLAHNNGNFFNKYVENDFFNIAATRPALAAVKATKGLSTMLSEQIKKKEILPVRTSPDHESDFWIVDTGLNTFARASIADGIVPLKNDDIPLRLKDVRVMLREKNPNTAFVVEHDGTIFALKQNGKKQ